MNDTNLTSIDDVFKSFNSIFGESSLFQQQDVKRYKSYSTDNDYILEFAVPGFERSEIEISVEADVLTLTAEVSEEEETFWKRSFTKEFRIPKDADDISLKAKLEKGLLIVSISKIPKVAKRNVTID